MGTKSLQPAARAFSSSHAKDEPIPGTGSFKKATTDPIQICAWWEEDEYLIGLPTGAASGVWCLDIDTSEDHADGVAEWEKIAAQHDPIVTREHRSATGGPHLIFNWSEAMPLGCSAGDLPDGISVKGEGGYIVLPPSQRKRRSYSVHSDIDPIDAPAWLTDLILRGRTPTLSPWDVAGPWDIAAVDLDELAEAMEFVPNPDHWEEWKFMAMRLYAGLGDQGWPFFHEWSQRWECYDPRTGPAEDRECWRQVQGSPPNRTGLDKIFAIAREHGWVPKLRTLPADQGSVATLDDEVTLEAGRERFGLEVVDFLSWVAIPESERDVWTDLYFENPNTDWPVTRAIAASTGIGKTRITIRELARWMHATGAGPVVYAVPRHKLGLEVVEQFSAHGLHARLFRGRDAIDPEHYDPSKGEDEQTRMCVNREVVAAAMLARSDISETCCKSGKQSCPYFGSCGYTRQLVDAEQVEIWIVASDMIFHSHKVFEKAVALIVDESFWAKGLRGVEHDDCSVPLAALQTKNVVDLETEEGERDYQRALLGNALAQQKDDGPIARQYLESTTTPAFKHEGESHRPRKTTLTPHDCTSAISLEWRLMPKLPLKPGMSLHELASRCNVDKMIDAIGVARNVITIWEAVRQVLRNPKIETAGRLLLQQRNGLREVRWRGVAEVKLWLPTLILDATLPDPSILKVFHPQVEVVADLKVAMPPGVRIRQVLGAPTSSNKLDSEKHLQELKRYILMRYHQTGRGKTLIVTQMKAANWLKRKGLPKNVRVEHYNAVTGTDIHRDVRLLISAGRVAPGPDAIESVTGALTGYQPVACNPTAKGFRWYERQVRGIAVRDGRPIKTIGDAHPDAVAEAVRWLVHEGELIQSIGRGRGLNRSPECPLDIDVLFDTALPITVDEVVRWEKVVPSLLLATAFDEGVVLTSPVDLVRLWSSLWPNEKAAQRCVQGGVPKLPGFTEITYKLKGAKMKRRTGWFDLDRVPDPYAWLAGRLGPLKPL